MSSSILFNVVNNIPYEFNEALYYKRLIIKSITLPVFNNVSSQLQTNIINDGVMDYVVDEMIYSIPADLITNLNTAFGGTYTSSISSQRVTISGAVNFSLNDSRLLNDILGFSSNQCNGSAASYTADFNINLFPYNYVVVDCDLDFKRITNNLNSISFVIPNKGQNFYYSNNEKNTLDTIDIELARGSNKSIKTVKFSFSVMFYDEEIRLIDFQNEKVGIILSYV